MRLPGGERGSVQGSRGDGMLIPGGHRTVACWPGRGGRQRGGEGDGPGETGRFKNSQRYWGASTGELGRAPRTPRPGWQPRPFPARGALVRKSSPGPPRTFISCIVPLRNRRRCIFYSRCVLAEKWWPSSAGAADAAPGQDAPNLPWKKAGEESRISQSKGRCP